MTKRDELIALGGVGVKVRELEWPPRCPRGQRVHNRPALVNYTVAHYGGDVGDAIYRWAEAHSPWSDPLPTYEAAKAAAQADYEARIKSALVEVPAVKGEPVVPCVDEDDADVVRVAHAIAEQGVGRPWDDFLPLNVNDIDHHDLIEYARAAVASMRTSPPADAGVREALENGPHYLGSIKQRLERLYEENPNEPGLREHLSDEVDWIDGLIEALTAPGATTKSDGGKPSIQVPEANAIDPAADSKQPVSGAPSSPAGHASSDDAASLDSDAVDRVAQAIRDYCFSIAPLAIKLSHGVERIYYAGLPVLELSRAIAAAIRSGGGE